MRIITITQLLGLITNEMYYLDNLIKSLNEVLDDYEKFYVPAERYNFLTDNIDKLHNLLEIYQAEYDSMYESAVFELDYDYNEIDLEYDEMINDIQIKCQNLRANFQRIHSTFILEIDNEELHEQLTHADMYMDLQAPHYLNLPEDSWEETMLIFLKTHTLFLENLHGSTIVALREPLQQNPNPYKFFSCQNDHQFMVAIEFLKENCDFFCATYRDKNFDQWKENNAILLGLLEVSLKNAMPFDDQCKAFSQGLLKYANDGSDGLLKHFLRHRNSTNLIETLNHIIKADSVVSRSFGFKIKMIDVIDKWRTDSNKNTECHSLTS
jgi:hypothetical protein